MFRPLLVIAVVAVCSLQANADIIVSVQDATVAAGGTGFVDVLISSDNNDALSLAGYEFQITGSNLFGDLTFRPDWDAGDPSNTANQSNSEQNQPDYVFAGDTDLAIFSAVVSPTATLIGGDFTMSGNDSNPLTTNYLLARLELLHTTPNAALAVGSTFTVSLLDNSPFTSFENSGGPLMFSSNVGTVTVTAAAVPEPSSCIALAALGGAYFLRRRMRQN